MTEVYVTPLVERPKTDRSGCGMVHPSAAGEPSGDQEPRHRKAKFKLDML